jgi:hypothetical protein
VSECARSDTLHRAGLRHLRTQSCSCICSLVSPCTRPTRSSSSWRQAAAPSRSRSTSAVRSAVTRAGWRTTAGTAAPSGLSCGLCSSNTATSSSATTLRAAACASCSATSSTPPSSAPARPRRPTVSRR